MDIETYLPGTASIIEYIDKRLMLVLRDGRYLIGTLRTFDQYLNLVIEDTVERITYNEYYSDLPLGVFLVRGDNLVLVGDIDEENEQGLPLKKVSKEEITEKVEMANSTKEIDWDLE